MKRIEMLRESNKNGGGEDPCHHPNRTRNEGRRLRLRLCFLDKENAYISMYIYIPCLDLNPDASATKPTFKQSYALTHSTQSQYA